MAASETKKCAHPVCTCQLTTEKYCSAECEAMEGTADVERHYASARNQGTGQGAPASAQLARR